MVGKGFVDWGMGGGRRFHGGEEGGDGYCGKGEG